MAHWRPDEDVLMTDSEDEEENELKRDFHGREAMLFVIDASLFKESARFLNALEIVRLAFISGMLANGKDLMGVIFTNTKLSPDPLEPGFLETIVIPDNCAVFLPILQLTKPIVEHYLRFLVNVEKEFEEQYGFVEEGGSFSATIRLSMDLFEFCGFPLNNATLIYMTDKETPHAPQSHEYSMAMHRATDLDSREIEFHVIPMIDEFNYELFYKEFMTLVRDVELDSFVEPDAQQLREILSNRKLKQDFLKRCLGHFRFQLGADLAISAQYYNYYKRRSYPRKVQMLRKNNAIVVPKTVITVHKLNDEATGDTEERTMKANEGWYEIRLGDMAIRITLQQMLRVRNLHAPGMMLLGFKPLSALPENLYYLPSNFMYPDDQSVLGSKRLFRALWECCQTRQKIAVCIFMRKRKSIPRYVALVPVSSADKSDMTFRALLYGDGFKMVYLPTSSHVRNLKLEEWCPLQNKDNNAGVAVFEQIIKKLRIRYEPSLINDPALERLQAELLALSLNIKTDNNGLTAMPDAAIQDQRIAKFLPEINEIFETDIALAKKRAIKYESDETKRSKVRKIANETIEQYDQVEHLIANKSIESCTVQQLKFILNAHFGVKLSANSTKPVLIERIYELTTKTA